MTRSTIRRVTIGLAAGAAAALALVGSSAATVIDRGQYSGADTLVTDECGPTYTVDSTFGGTYKIRVGTDGEGFPEQYNYWFREVWTNPATGKWFVVRGNGIVKDVKAVQVGTSTVYRFTRIEAGQPFVIEDLNGRVVSSDRGSIRWTYLWDTLGDGQPGGVFLGDDPARVNGPHPAFADDFPFCGIAAQLTAAGS